MPRMLALPLALVFTSALVAQPLPAGTVVAGVGTHEGTRTDVTAFLPDGTTRVLFVEEHAAGFVPKGALHDGRVALAVQHDGADGASVVVLDLASGTNGANGASGARVVAGERAIASQAPRITAGDRVTWVRAAEKPTGSTFDVVTTRIDHDERGTISEEVLASIDGAWLTPLDATHFVHITNDGTHRVVAARDASLELVRELGKGPLRRPALTSGAPIVERAIGNGRARLERGGVTLREGIAGMDPLVVDGARDVVVAGAGSKRSALVVYSSEGERVFELGRAGVATPLAAAMVRDGLVIVARLDRGRALPAEHWLVSARGSRALATRGVVEVYGIVGDASPTAGGAQ